MKIKSITNMVTLWVAFFAIALPLIVGFGLAMIGRPSGGALWSLALAAFIVSSISRWLAGKDVDDDIIVALHGASGLIAAVVVGTLDADLLWHNHWAAVPHLLVMAFIASTVTNGWATSKLEKGINRFRLVLLMLGSTAIAALAVRHGTGYVDTLGPQDVLLAICGVGCLYWRSIPSRKAGDDQTGPRRYPYLPDEDAVRDGGGPAFLVYDDQGHRAAAPSRHTISRHA